MPILAFTWVPGSLTDYITVIGFIATLTQISRIRAMVEKEIARLQAIHSLSSIQEAIGEIKRLVLVNSSSSGDRALLPYKCASLRKTLIEVEVSLGIEDKNRLSTLIIQLTNLENAEMAARQQGVHFDSTALFPVINDHLTDVSRILARVLTQGN